MTSCCRRPPTRSNGATADTGRCNRRCIACDARKRYGAGWLWICNGTSKHLAAGRQPRSFTKLAEGHRVPLSLLQSHFFPDFLLLFFHRALTLTSTCTRDKV